MSIPPDFTRRVQENPQIAVELYEALERIAHSYRALLSRKPVRDVQETLAEVEVALAKAEAPTALSAHAHYRHELALDAAARTGETPLVVHLPGVPGME
jgi:hypothetical protein